MTVLKSWQVVKKRRLFALKPWIQVDGHDVKLPTGRIVKNFIRVTTRDYAAIIARTPNGKIIMERQYKHGHEKVSYVLPGGVIDKGESALKAAKRELLEETGFKANNWTDLGTYIESGNYLSCRGFFFSANNAVKIEEPHSGDLEEMQIVLLSPKQIAQAIKQKQIVSLPVIAGLALGGII